MKAFVSGASGFIGGALASYLEKEGWEVHVLVRPTALAKLPRNHRYRVLVGNLGQDVPGLREAVRGSDVVFHAAAIRDRWGTTLDTYQRVNIEGTRRLLEACLGQVQRFVYLSSVGVFGKQGVLGIDETFPLSTSGGKIGYHGSKVGAERVVLERVGDIEVVVIRPTITYGPGDWDGMLTRLIAMIKRGRFLLVGDGTNHFHLTYITDLVHGLHLAGTHPAAPGQIFIVAGPASIAVAGLLQMIEQSLNRKASRHYIPERLARLAAASIEIVYQAGASLDLAPFRSPPIITRDKIDTLCSHRGFSSAKAEQLLGYLPKVNYLEGLSCTMAWMASNGLL